MISVFYFISQHFSEIQLGISTEKTVRKKIKCFSNEGSQVK